MRTLLPPRKEKAHLDVSLAIVNIVLLLILFFLATGSLMNSPDTGIDLARSRDLPLDALPQPLLMIEPDGTLLLDGAPVPRDELVVALSDTVVLHVLIDKEAPALDLIDILATPGLETLAIDLVTIREREDGV